MWFCLNILQQQQQQQQYQQRGKKKEFKKRLSAKDVVHFWPLLKCWIFIYDEIVSEVLVFISLSSPRPPPRTFHPASFFFILSTPLTPTSRPSSLHLTFQAALTPPPSSSSFHPCSPSPSSLDFFSSSSSAEGNSITTWKMALDFLKQVRVQRTLSHEKWRGGISTEVTKSY